MGSRRRFRFGWGVRVAIGVGRGDSDRNTRAQCISSPFQPWHHIAGRRSQMPRPRQANEQHQRDDGPVRRTKRFAIKTSRQRVSHEIIRADSSKEKSSVREWVGKKIDDLIQHTPVKSLVGPRCEISCMKRTSATVWSATMGANTRYGRLRMR